MKIEYTMNLLALPEEEEVVGLKFCPKCGKIMKARLEGTRKEKVFKT